MKKSAIFLLVILAALPLWSQSAAARQYFQTSPKSGTTPPTQLGPRSTTPSTQLGPRQRLAPTPLMPMKPRPVRRPVGPAPIPEAQVMTVAEAFPDIPFDPSYNMSLEYASQFVREGWARNNRPVAIGQFEFAEGVGYLGAWGVYDLNNQIGRKWRFEESRFYAGVAGDFAGSGKYGPLSYDLSWSYLYYPGRTDMNSAEICFGLALHRCFHGENWRLGFNVNFIHDYELEESTIAPAATYTLSFNKERTIDLEIRAELYWGDTEKARNMTDGQCDSNAFYAAVLRATLNWEFADGWTLSPSIAASTAPDRRARHAKANDELNSAGTIWGTIRLTRSF